jgi:hypothetical protein
MTARKRWKIAVWILCVGTFFATTTLNAQESASKLPLIKQINNGNWFPQQQAEQFRDDLYYHNAGILSVAPSNSSRCSDGWGLCPLYNTRFAGRCKAR